MENPYVHRDMIVACARTPEADDTASVTKQKFSTTRKGLGELIVFLLDASIGALSAEITARLVPFEGTVAIITSVTGIKKPPPRCSSPKSAPT